MGSVIDATTETAIIDRALRGEPVASIARAVNMSRATVGYVIDRSDVVTGRVHLDTVSLRQAVLHLVKANKLIRDSRDLIPMLKEAGRKDDLHNVQHVLNSLEKAGLISFTRRNHGNVTVYERITSRRTFASKPLPSVWEVKAAAVEPEVAPQPVENAPQEPAEPAPAVSAHGLPYPILEGLLARAIREATRSNLAERLIEVAAMLEAEDPEGAGYLEAKANALTESSLNATEREYIKYVRDHEDQPWWTESELRAMAGDR